MNKLWLLVFVLSSFQLNAQRNESSVSLSVYFSNSPLENVTVEILKSTDSSLLKTSLTDKTGFIQFENISFGTYTIRASSIGFSNLYSPAFNLSEKNPAITLPILEMVKKINELQNIVITGKKPFIQKLNDRIVVNVSASTLNSGSTALEVLERLPGITIDQNSSISLRGKQGVIVMIDGKPSALSGNELANYLKSLPSESIDRIDIITNPSSNYEASGSSGIIDIHLKKDQRLGINGTVTAVYGQGLYSRGNIGSTFNFRNKLLNVFGNYNRKYQDQYNEYISHRIFTENGKTAGSYDQDDFIKFPEKGNSARFGVDFFPDSKTIIGIEAHSNLSHWNRVNNDGSSTINEFNQPDSGFFTRATSDDHFDNIVANINFKHSFNSGSDLSADADYGVFSSSSLSNNKTDFFDANGNKQHPTFLLDGTQKGKLEIKSSKIDYNKIIFKNGKLEAGVKKSIVSSLNDAVFYNISTPATVFDTLQSNHYNYIENNTAAYISLNKEIKKLNIQFGIRGEQTKFNGRQATGNFHFDSTYFQLFPSTTINYKIREDENIGFAISRRIDRPSYDQMNPLTFLLDISTYISGNPDLKPQFTWAYELNYTLKQVNVALNYSHTSNRITVVATPNEKLSSKNKIVNLQTFINLPEYQFTGLTVSFPVKLFRWWNLMSNGTIFHSYYSGYYNNTKLSAGNFSGNLSINSSFNFKGGWSGELNVSYNSPVREGFILEYSKWQLNAGIQKTILKNRGSIKLSITDIFRKNIDRGINEVTNYFEKWSSLIDTRAANLTFTYRFGNSKVAAARIRTTSSEEEAKRAGH